MIVSVAGAKFCDFFVNKKEEKFFVFQLLWLFTLVYVIGLHAVQFGNNWMRKIPRTAKLDEAVGRVQFGSPRNFLNPIISKFDKHVVLLPIIIEHQKTFFCFFLFKVCLKLN